jgi:hypothetical protein
MGAASLFLLASAYIPARAAGDPCPALGQFFMEREKLIAQINEFHKKKPTAELACQTFTSLSKATSTTIAAVERDGAWCHVPEAVAPNLKTQLSQIDKAKAGACKVAADQQKAQKDGKNQQFLGGNSDDVLGGPAKLPQGAL